VIAEIRCVSVCVWIEIPRRLGGQKPVSVSAVQALAQMDIPLTHIFYSL